MAAALSVSLLQPANPHAESPTSSTYAHPNVGPAAAACPVTPLAGCGLFPVSSREDALPGLGRNRVPVGQFTPALIQAQLLCHPLLNPRSLMIVVYFHASIMLLKAVTSVSKVFVIIYLFYNLMTVTFIIIVWANALSLRQFWLFLAHTHTHSPTHTRPPSHFIKRKVQKALPSRTLHYLSKLLHKTNNYIGFMFVQIK